MQIEVSLFDLRTVFCKFNCSLACVRNTVNGISLGFLHSPGFSWAGRDKIYTSEQDLQQRNFYWHILHCPNSKVSVLYDHSGHRFKVSFALGPAQMLEETFMMGDRSFSFKNRISQ